MKNVTQVYRQDFSVFIQAMSSLQESRKAQILELYTQKAELRAKNDAQLKTLADEREALKNVKEEHAQNVLEWKKKIETQKEERKKVLKQRKWLEMQLRSDNQRAAEFMSRMLQKEHQLQQLKEYTPKCKLLQHELARVAKENEEIFELLREVLTHVETTIPIKVAAAEKCRQLGIALENQFKQVLKKYNKVCVDADMFVEDILPYEKVATRPGGYQNRAGIGRPGVRQGEKKYTSKFQGVAAEAMMKMMGKLEEDKNEIK